MISDKITLDISLNTLKKLKKNGIKLAEGAFIHSDQGFRYCKKIGVGHSMYRRGNCWDNAPQESLFGHFKDETDLRACENTRRGETGN